MNRRNYLGALLALPVANLGKAKPKKVVLSVVLFNYLDRPIFDVFVDGKMGFGSDAFPATGGGIVTGVAFELGPKKVSWRLDGPAGTPRNGETVFNKNPLRLDAVVLKARYLGLHIYPDDTVELTTSVSLPDKTKRGVAMVEQSNNHRG
jgi:hypothetical protein